MGSSNTARSSGNGGKKKHKGHSKKGSGKEHKVHASHSRTLAHDEEETVKRLHLLPAPEPREDSSSSNADVSELDVSRA